MRTSIRQIGNSKGFIVPSSILAQTGVTGEVEMLVKDQAIIISPIKSKKREGWFDNYNVEKDIDAWDGFVILSDEEDDWEW